VALAFVVIYRGAVACGQMLGWLRAEAARASRRKRFFGLVHNAHPAATELLDDAVVRDGLTHQ